MGNDKKYPQQCSKTPGAVLKFLVHPHTARPIPSHGYSIQNYLRKSGQQKNRVGLKSDSNIQIRFLKMLPSPDNLYTNTLALEPKCAHPATLF